MGSNKAIAAAIGGALATIVIWALNRYLPPPPIPAEITAAIQTIIVTGLVWFIPHKFGQ